MGEYWMPVNIDKREYIDPNEVGNSLKRYEWMFDINTAELRWDSATMRRITALIATGKWGERDEIRALSDSGRTSHIRGRVTARDADYDAVEDSWRDVSTEGPPDA